MKNKTMFKFIISILFISLTYYVGQAQNAIKSTSEIVSINKLDPLQKKDINDKFTEYKIYEINNKKIYNSIKSVQGEINLNINLKDGLQLNFKLKKNNLYSADFLERSRTTVDRKTSLEPAINTYKGYVNDTKNNHVRATITKDWMTFKFSINNVAYKIEPVDFKDKHNSLYVAYKEVNQKNIQEFSCGTPKLVQNTNKISEQTAKIYSNNSCKEIRIKLSMDYDMVLQHGSNLMNYVEGQLNIAEGYYMNLIKFSIVDIQVWDGPSLLYD